MRITALEEYGLRCLLTLAKQGNSSHLTIPEIAQLEGLSVPYASKLLSILRRAGLVTAARGRTGGFCLSRAPEEINLFDVVTTLGGPLIDSDHCSRFAGKLEACVHLDNCSVHSMLDGLAGYVETMLRAVSIRDLIEMPQMRGAFFTQQGTSHAGSIPTADAQSIEAARPEST